MLNPLFPDVKWHDAINAIQQASAIHLITHCTPDADGIGSQIALFEALQRLGKQVFMHNQDAVPRICRYLDKSEQIHVGASCTRASDLVIALDAGSRDRLGLTDSYYMHKKLLNIDHHASNDGYGDINIVDARYCSTGAMIYDLLQAMNVPLTPTIASAIYATVMTDTASFRISTVNGDVHRMVGVLMDAGANAATAAKSLYFNHRVERFQLLKLALSTLELRDHGQSSWLCVDHAMYVKSGATSEDTEGFIDYARSIQGVYVAIFIRAEKEHWKVSMRGDTVDVSRIAMQFGGGGHRYAAGFSARGELAELQHKLQQAVSQLFSV